MMKLSKGILVYQTWVTLKDPLEQNLMKLVMGKRLTGRNVPLEQMFSKQSKRTKRDQEVS